METRILLSPLLQLSIRGMLLAGLFAFLTACAAKPPPAPEPTLWSTLEKWRAKPWVDLTHAFDANIPHWKGFKPMRTKVLYQHDKHGFLAEEYCHVGQWGTHVDPPLHFHKGMRSADEIDVKEMVLPLVVFDVHEKVEKNPDYQLTLEDIRDWEEKHGPVPEGAFAAMRTDWSKRWPDRKKMQNLDAKGVAHYPGWSAETLSFLYNVRKIAASGHEPTDTDPGIATSKDDYSLESFILKNNHYQIELLTNLDKVPSAGAVVIASWPKVSKGSGFPARIFAILPE